MGRGTIRNTVSNGHGKRSPRAMASTASERNSTLPWQISMIESSGGGVGDAFGGEVCGGSDVDEDVSAVFNVDTHAGADRSLCAS